MAIGRIGGGAPAPLDPGGSKFRPTFPNLFSANRRPIHELDLATVRKEFGYSGPAGKSDVPLPTLGEVARLAREHPELEQICLDVKLPPGRPDLARRMAERVKATLEAEGIDPSRVFLLHNDAATVKALKDGMGAGYDVAHDVEIVSLLPDSDDYSATASADAVGSRTASVGRPRIGVNAYDEYIEVLKKDRARIDAEGGNRKLITWTINDENQLREVIALGVDGIITDNPEGLRRLLARLGLEG
jgi:glycerophosphoryl diester phosphodiesterase